MFQFSALLLAVAGLSVFPMRTSIDVQAKDIHAKINKLKKMCQSRNLAIEKLENDLKVLDRKIICCDHRGRLAFRCHLGVYLTQHPSKHACFTGRNSRPLKLLSWTAKSSCWRHPVISDTNEKSSRKHPSCSTQ